MTIRKSVTVRCSPETAFRIFTRDIGRWWPLHLGFSFGGERKQAVFLDNHAGGRFYERLTDGSEFEIGRVTRADPPDLILFTWHPPNRDAGGEVEVRFSAVPDGTRVDLEHRGLEPTSAREKAFTGGWDTVLAHYVAAANDRDTQAEEAER